MRSSRWAWSRSASARAVAQMSRGALHGIAFVEEEGERPLAQGVAAGELVLQALPLEEVAHEEEAQAPAGELAELRRQEALGSRRVVARVRGIDPCAAA